jgi:hypothetical protein
LAPFDFTRPDRSVVAYPAGYIGKVDRVVARAAIAAGKAERYKVAESTDSR